MEKSRTQFREDALDYVNAILWYYHTTTCRYETAELVALYESLVDLLTDQPEFEKDVAHLKKAFDNRKLPGKDWCMFFKTYTMSLHYMIDGDNA